MSALAWQDRFWRGVAYWVDRPVLAVIGSQALLRALFALSSRMGSRMPRDVAMSWDKDGALWLHPQGLAGYAPVLMYIHGGGFTIGSPRTHAALAAYLARAAGMVVILPRYRLAPAHPCPAAREDIIAAHGRLVATGRAPVALAALGAFLQQKAAR